MAVNACEIRCTNAEKLGEYRAEIDNLKSWQRTQYVSLDRLADRIDKIGERLNTMQWWLIGLMGGIIASLILLVVNLISKG
jgi:cell division protein FtsX